MLGHGLLSSGLWSRGAGTVVVTGRLVGAPANNVIAVALPAGPPLRVAVPANAQLSRLASAPVGSLGVGARVLVHGRPNADRSIAATSIFVLPPQTR